MGSHSATEHRQRPEPMAAAERWLLAGAAVVVAGLLLIEAVGGRSWTWTGFQDNQHLWDWLHLLLLPVVLALLPVLSRHRPRRPQGWGLVGLVACGLLLVLVVIDGYVVPWAWTGFTGNTLWDWLELLLLPVSVSLLPFALQSHAAVRTRWLAAFGLFLLGFLLLAVPGYVVPWRWTGVTGNTLWDWLQLLVVPFALPVTVVLVMHDIGQQER